jgi:hypothetical protein
MVEERARFGQTRGVGQRVRGMRKIIKRFKALLRKVMFV